MSPEPSPDRARLASRGELIRLAAAGFCLLLAVWFVFKPSSPQSSPEPVVGISGEGPRISMDPRAAQATLERKLQEESGQVAAVRTAAFQLDRSTFEGIDDSALEVVEEPAFYQLVAFLHHMPDEELARAAEKHGSFDWEQLHTKDRSGIERARGKFITLRGRFITRLFQRVLVTYPNEAGLAWVWQGTFRAQNRGFFVTITDKDFDPVPGPYGTPVELTGAFLRIYRYQPEDEGASVKSLPHLVVKRIERVESALDIRHNYPHFVGWIMGGLLAVTFGGLLLYTRAGRKGDAQAVAWLRAQQRKRLERGGRPPARSAPGPAASAATPAATSPAAMPPAAMPPAASPAPLAQPPAVEAFGAQPPVATLQTGAEPPPAAQPTVAESPGTQPPVAPAVSIPVTPAPPATACPVCAQAVPPGTERVVCGACLRPHHRPCWTGTCAGCGGTEGLVPLARG